MLFILEFVLSCEISGVSYVRILSFNLTILFVLKLFDQMFYEFFAFLDLIWGESLVVALFPFTLAVTKASVMPVVAFFGPVVVVDSRDALSHLWMEYIPIFQVLRYFETFVYVTVNYFLASFALSFLLIIVRRCMSVAGSFG